MTELTHEKLLRSVEYDSQTGVFRWKDRPRSDFKSGAGYAAWRAKCLGKETGCPTGHGYISICINNQRYLAHRLAWFYFHGAWPSDHIDHINGNGEDNRIVNLRVVTNAENHRNTKMLSTNTSGVVGVRLDHRYGTWKATIWQSPKRINLGSFKTMGEAVAARKAAEVRLGYHPNHGRVDARLAAAQGKAKGAAY